MMALQELRFDWVGRTQGRSREVGTGGLSTASGREGPGCLQAKSQRETQLHVEGGMTVRVSVDLSPDEHADFCPLQGSILAPWWPG